MLIMVQKSIWILVHILSVSEINGSVVNNFSFIFQWHSNSTPLNNLTPTQICQGSTVIFAIQNNLSGIGQNYPGSLYRIDFNDGSEDQIMMFSHAELMIDNGLAVSSHQIEHDFNLHVRLAILQLILLILLHIELILRCKLDLEMICLHLIKVVMNI